VLLSGPRACGEALPIPLGVAHSAYSHPRGKAKAGGHPRTGGLPPSACVLSTGLLGRLNGRTGGGCRS
jgi:hypothetical protein